MLTLSQIIQTVRDKETDPINKARVLMAFYLMLAYFIFGAVLSFAYFYTNHTPQLIRSSVITILSLSFLVILYYFNSWRVISHLILLLITVLGVWANLLLYVRGVNVATLQNVWLVSALGFYMHGSKWGWFYTIFGILPILMDATLPSNAFYVFSAPMETIAKPIYILVLLFGFFTITFLQYFFFKAFNRNIISLKTAKNLLNETNNQLNLKIHEVNELSKSRMGFLSTMSHELRTPLNGVIGLTNVLLLQNPRKDQEETLGVLHFSAENLLAIVNDILDFNKLDSERVALEQVPFSLSDFIANIYASTKLRADEKHLNFNYKISEDIKHITLVSDPTRLSQVLLNLINNAIKFTEKGGVNLICSATNISENTVKIHFFVEDTGIGIAASQKERIFEEFVQAATNTNRKFGGTGLGLPIVKKVLSLYNSSMHIDSVLGVGTNVSFEIEFPFQLQPAEKVSRNYLSDMAAKDLSALKILVVEDNLVNIMVITKTLNRVGIQPDVAENGKLAIDKVEKNHYDLILMDLYMPELDGYEAAKSIRVMEDLVKSKVPIVAITATVNNKVLEDVLAAGMNGYLSKPFHPNDLFDELRKYVN